jgi:hypothetical protein
VPGPSLQLPRNKFLDPPLEDAAGEADAMLALKAFDADIRPQPHHLPLVAAARVRLLKANNVTELDIHGYIMIRGLTGSG